MLRGSVPGIEAQGIVTCKGNLAVIEKLQWCKVQSAALAELSDSRRHLRCGYPHLAQGRPLVNPISRVGSDSGGRGARDT